MAAVDAFGGPMFTKHAEAMWKLLLTEVSTVVGLTIDDDEGGF